MSSGRPMSMQAVLGYDPWAFPILVRPRSDFSRILFGWFCCEAFKSFSTLYAARTKWKSKVYITILAATCFGSASGVLAFLSICSLGTTAMDPFAGPSEFGIATAAMVAMQLARISYFYSTVRITLSVFPNNGKAKAAVYVVTFAALVGSLIFTVVGIVFQGVLYKQYLIYESTRDIGVVLGRIFTDVIPMAENMKPAAVTQTATMIVFILVTNSLFLLEIINNLKIPFYKACVSGASSCAIQRIVANVILTIVEASISISQGACDLALMMTWFAVMFEVNTLASLAFDHSAQIVKEHSTMHRITSRKQDTSSTGEGPAKSAVVPSV